MEDTIFGAGPGQFSPSEALIDKVLFCCDLTGVALAGGRLERVMLFGCDLTGADFSNSVIDDVRFVHCFSAPARPIDFRQARSSGLSNEQSSISTRGSLASHFVNRWPDEADQCAARLRAPRNDVRFRTIKEIARSSRLSELLYPLLGVSLVDPEWEVRDAALQALVTMRAVMDVFRPFDPWMKQWMLHRLGDPSPFVRATAKRVLPAFAPADAQLQCFVNGATHEPIGRMRACDTLLRLDNRYAALIDFDMVRQMAAGGGPVEARLLAIDALQTADDRDLRTILPALMSDAEPEIRARALNAVGIVAVPGAERLTRAAMRDPDWRVRLQALDTAEELGCLDADLIEAASHDPSEKIREFAATRRRR